VRAAHLANRRYQALLGDDYGVRWIENYDCRDEDPNGFLDGAAIRPIIDLYPEVKTYGPGEHPFPTRYATRFLTMLIEPNRYLRALVRDALARGIRIVQQSFATMQQLDVTAASFPVIVNCTGLGAKELAGDAELEPVRGQLSVLAPQPAVDYITLHGGRYMFPRSDGVVLGGTFQHGNAELAPDDATQRQIVADHAAFFDAMKAG
jgi:D-amino-acid oxidase